jgi:hypothetical protein
MNITSHDAEQYRHQALNAGSNETILGGLFAQRGVVLSRKQLVEYLAQLDTSGDTHCAAPAPVGQVFPEVADEVRFLVGEFWGHRFDASEAEVRFVVDRRCGKMLWCEAYEATWKPCSPVQYAHLLGSLYDTRVMGDPSQWEELSLVGKLPYWAAMPLTLRTDLG